MDCSCASMFRFFLWRQMAPQQSAKFRTAFFGQFRTSLRMDSVANYGSFWKLFSTSVTEPDVLCNALNISQIRLYVAPQDSQNCGRHFAKRKLTDAEFAGNSLLCMVITDIESNTSLGGLTLDPAGMHCPWWDDAFVSSLFVMLRVWSTVRSRGSTTHCVAVYCQISTRFSAFFRRDRSLRCATYFSFPSLGGATMFAKLRSKIAKIQKNRRKSLCAPLRIDRPSWWIWKKATAVCTL